MIRRWDFQVSRNPWLSLGFHLDHTDPSLTLHLPGVIVAFGNLKQPGFRSPVRVERSYLDALARLERPGARVLRLGVRRWEEGASLPALSSFARSFLYGLSGWWRV